ncbi:MAG: DUF554 domain-containing protein [Oscillospiraceae bacterium]|jgi:uncharacterized membrane protein YqgA involved in biofilm formation|nr:DUF554 domain-containing protein [Oscillospiraceae bacterium]
MIGLGTIENCAAIIIGAGLGLLMKGRLPKRFQETIMHGVALAVLFIGLGGALAGLLTLTEGELATRNTMLMVLSLVLGAIVGEALDLDAKLNRLGEWTKKKVPERLAGSSFVSGFVSASMLFCIGAMAVVGSLQDGLSGDSSTLFAKAVIDGTTSIILAASLGFGVMCSAVPVLIYQGLITLLARFIAPYLSDMLISQLSCVGSILIFAIGLNMLFPSAKIKVANLLPAIFFPILLSLLKSLWPGFPI